jgi:hypothetical protein
MWLLFLVLVLLPSVAFGQECRADMNGNGQTDVSDLVAAVNEALRGCGGPTDGCPYDFRDDTVAQDRRCIYRGTADGDCPALVAWESNGDRVEVVLLDATPEIRIAFYVTGPDGANAIEWSDDGFATATNVRGTLSPSPTQLGMTLTGTGTIRFPGCHVGLFLGDFQSVGHR